MTILLLIRHATNDWMRRGRLAGWTPNVHLNQEGQEQAQALGRRLADIPLEAVYSSPLERAVETAQAIAGPHGLKVQLHQGVGEVQYGEWNGQPLRKLAREPLWRVVQRWPGGARFPGGEALGEMQARVVAALEKVRAAHPQGVVAVVAHADVIKAAVAYYIGVPLDLFQRLVISPASVTAVGFTPLGPRLLRLNDTGRIEFPRSTPRRRRRQAKSARLLAPRRRR